MPDRGPEPDLSDELAAAARCAGMLESAGLRIAFAPGRAGERVAVELRRSTGELVRELAPSEVLEVIGMDATDLGLWLAETAAT